MGLGRIAVSFKKTPWLSMFQNPPGPISLWFSAPDLANSRWNCVVIGWRILRFGRGNPLTPDHNLAIQRVSEVAQLPKRTEKNQMEVGHNIRGKHTAAGPALGPKLKLPLRQ